MRGSRFPTPLDFKYSIYKLPRSPKDVPLHCECFPGIRTPFAGPFFRGQQGSLLAVFALGENSQRRRAGGRPMIRCNKSALGVAQRLDKSFEAKARLSSFFLLKGELRPLENDSVPTAFSTPATESDIVIHKPTALNKQAATTRVVEMCHAFRPSAKQCS